MPGFDGSGPMGGGPMTGGARGYCNPGYAGNTGYGRFAGYGRGMAYRRGGGRGGFGPGRGLGRGYGAAYPPVYSPQTGDELNMLKQQADSIKNTLDSINSRIAELESDG